MYPEPPELLALVQCRVHVAVQGVAVIFFYLLRPI